MLKTKAQVLAEVAELHKLQAQDLRWVFSGILDDIEIFVEGLDKTRREPQEIFRSYKVLASIVSENIHRRIDPAYRGNFDNFNKLFQRYIYGRLFNDESIAREVILGRLLNVVPKGDAPPSEPADTFPHVRMPDDFKTKVKKAKVENLARSGVSAAHALATYRALVRNVDLLNPSLSEAEKLTRAEGLMKAYTRLRKVKPDFRDTGEQMRAANRIRMADYRRRKRATEALRHAAL